MFIKRRDCLLQGSPIQRIVAGDFLSVPICIGTETEIRESAAKTDIPRGSRVWVAQKDYPVITFSQRRKHYALSRHFLIREHCTGQAVACFVKYGHLYLVYLVREDFRLSVSQIAEVDHVPVVAITVILADAGTQESPHQQNDYIYVIELHENY
jgi:hypothetical protein